jgi:hypothetical protein
MAILRPRATIGYQGIDAQVRMYVETRFDRSRVYQTTINAGNFLSHLPM